MIGRTDFERDLGVLVNSGLKLRKQCISVRNRASRVLGFINRTVTNRSADVILRLYLALVRPHLRLCCPVLVPTLQNRHQFLRISS